MAQPKRVDSLDISQNLPYQKKFWKVERGGWMVFAVLLLLTALGLAGGQGPLNQTMKSNQQLEVEYQPFARRVAPTDIEIRLKELSGDSAQLMIDSEFLQRYQVQQITPEPSDVKASADILTYEFSLPEGATEMTVVFALEPNTTSVGNISGQIGRTTDDLLTINQWVYP